MGCSTLEDEPPRTELRRPELELNFPKSFRKEFVTGGHAQKFPKTDEASLEVAENDGRGAAL